MIDNLTYCTFTHMPSVPLNLLSGGKFPLILHLTVFIRLVVFIGAFNPIDYNHTTFFGLFASNRLILIVWIFDRMLHFDNFI